MSTITTTVAAAGPNPAGQPWRNPIHRTADGYRALLYSDGAHLRLASSQDGSSWAIFPTNISTESITAFPRLITSAMTAEALYVLIGHATGIIDSYRIPYSGSGVWSAYTTRAGIISGLTNVPLSMMAAYDPAGATVDVDHVTGAAGIIHLLIDCGAIWHFYGLDPHTSGAAPKLVCEGSVIPAGTGPTANTNYVLRKMNELYALSAMASAWEGQAVTYTSSSGTSSHEISGPATLTYADAVSWYDSASGVAVGTALTNSHYYETAAHQVGGHPVPTESSASGAPTRFLGYGKTFATVAGYTYPDGTWAVSLPLASANISGAIRLGLRLYDGVKGTLLGTIPVQSTTIADGPNTLICSLFLPGFTVTAGGSLQIELDLAPLGITQSGFSGTLALSSATISTPTPTKISTTTTTVNQYTAKREVPALTVNANGGGLAAAADGSVDLFSAATATGIEVVRRSPVGGYSAKVTLPATALDISSAAAAALDPVGGDEVVFALGTFSGAKHIGYIRRTGSVWGAWTELEGVTPNDTQAFAVVDDRGLGLAGEAAAWTNSAIPPALLWTDNGFAGGAIGAQKPTDVQIVDSPDADDAFGTVSPFSASTRRPWVRFVYRAGTAGDRMAAYQMIVKNAGTLATVYDSGRVSVSAGPLPDASYAAQVGADLTVGVSYLITVYTWDAVTGVESVASDAITVNIVAIPAVAVTGPSPVGSQFDGVTIEYWQAAAVPGGTYRVRLRDAGGVERLAYGPISLTVPLVATRLSADATHGATTISTDQAPTTGRQIAIGVGAAHEIRSVLSSSGAGPYTVTLDAALANDHADGDQVATVFITDGLEWLTAFENGSALTIAVDVWTQIASGASWFGTGELASVLSIAAPPAPAGLYSNVVRGADPLHGGYVALLFNQDAGNGGSTPNPARWRLEQREYGAEDWQRVTGPLEGDFPASVGRHLALHAYSAPLDVAMDYAVSAVSADGVSSTRSIVLGVTLSPRLGMWLNDPADPETCVELGVMPPGSTLLTWDTTQEQDFAILLGREKPVLTISEAYSYQFASPLTFKLERPYERASLKQLETWHRAGATLQLRDPYGDMRYVALRKQQPGAYALSAYRTVVVDFAEVDAGPYGLLAVVGA